MLIAESMALAKPTGVTTTSIITWSNEDVNSRYYCYAQLWNVDGNAAKNETVHG